MSIAKVAYWILSPVLKTQGDKSGIYLTFDDGPHPQHTPEILDALKAHNAKATFFFNGDAMSKYPDLVHRTCQEGHQIGYHSFVHQSLKERKIFEIYDDLKRGKLILKKLQITEFLFRPPYGDLSIKSIVLLVFNGWKIIKWNIESRDSFDSQDDIVARLSPCQVKPGSIILLHDVYEQTARLAPLLIKQFIDQGYTLQKISFRRRNA